MSDIKMQHPDYDNKHTLKSIFTPADLLSCRRRKRAPIPRDIIIIYDPGLFKRITARYAPQKTGQPLYGATLYRYKEITIARMKGIGAPHAAAVLEELIACGGKRFFNVSTAGGLAKPGIYLCTKALRDEGTSRHYLKPARYAFPDQELFNTVAEELNKAEVEYSRAPTWTTDAPYRETREEITSYSREGIATVDMETAALFAVAACRRVQCVSMFAVSDLLSGEWEPLFHKTGVKKQLDTIFEIAAVSLGK